MLRPGDLPVALRLLHEPGETYESIGEHLGIATSSAYRSTRRLEGAGLLIPGTRGVNRHALFRFIAFGAPHAFFCRPGQEMVAGVLTGPSAPGLADAFDDAERLPLVWPHPEGEAVGLPVEPLYDGASLVKGRDGVVYHGLALFDTLRAGRTGDRKRAAELLRDMIVLA